MNVMVAVKTGRREHTSRMVTDSGWRRDALVVLDYAMIVARALPDLRDGLKPAQRRILYAILKRLHQKAGRKHRRSVSAVHFT